MSSDRGQASYSFRQASNADFDFLYDLHVAAMRRYVERLWGWEEAWQLEYFSRKFDAQKRKIILIDGQDAGVLVVEQKDNQIYIALIEILPRFQGRGVGTAIITNLCNQARERNQPVTLHVLKSNVPARRLYERLGFVVAGEEEYRIRMIKEPVKTTNENIA
jgi:ribosomal protein S18 acetylase RimI-like enzyme